MENQKILILNFGGQYDQLIARRVRECHVYCEVKPYTTTIEAIKEFDPIGIIFSSAFMSMLSINGLQLKNLTAYNAYITDIIIAAIVYFSSFSLLIKMLLSRKKKEKKPAAVTDVPAPAPAEEKKEEE